MRFRYFCVVSRHFERSEWAFRRPARSARPPPSSQLRDPARYRVVTLATPSSRSPSRRPSAIDRARSHLFCKIDRRASRTMAILRTRWASELSRSAHQQDRCFGFVVGTNLAGIFVTSKTCQRRLICLKVSRKIFVQFSIFESKIP
jgi:hypothetical protein